MNDHVKYDSSRTSEKLSKIAYTISKTENDTISKPVEPPVCNVEDMFKKWGDYVLSEEMLAHPTIIPTKFQTEFLQAAVTKKNVLTILPYRKNDFSGEKFQAGVRTAISLFVEFFSFPIGTSNRKETREIHMEEKFQEENEMYENYSDFREDPRSEKNPEEHLKYAPYHYQGDYNRLKEKDELFIFVITPPNELRMTNEPKKYKFSNILCRNNCRTSLNSLDANDYEFDGNRVFISPVCDFDTIHWISECEKHLVGKEVIVIVDDVPDEYYDRLTKFVATLTNIKMKSFQMLLFTSNFSIKTENFSKLYFKDDVIRFIVDYEDADLTEGIQFIEDNYSNEVELLLPNKQKMSLNKLLLFQSNIQLEEPKTHELEGFQIDAEISRYAFYYLIVTDFDYCDRRIFKFGEDDVPYQISHLVHTKKELFQYYKLFHSLEMKCAIENMERLFDIMFLSATEIYEFLLSIKEDEPDVYDSFSDPEKSMSFRYQYTKELVIQMYSLLKNYDKHIDIPKNSIEAITKFVKNVKRPDRNCMDFGIFLSKRKVPMVSFQRHLSSPKHEFRKNVFSYHHCRPSSS